MLKPGLTLGGPGTGAYAAAGLTGGPGYGRQMSGRQVDVLVIGAGVSGLTTAVCLAEAGLTVDVAAARPPRRTTSAAAGAIWGPHLVGLDERVARWGQVTLTRLRHLAGDPATGVRAVSGVTCFRTVQPPEPPAWTDGVGERARCEDAELPAGFTCGWRFTAPVICMPVYLDYLLARFLSTGGQVQDDRVFASLAAAAGQASAAVIVNCCGIGAHDLVPDPAVLPVRGQVVVTANPGISEFFIGPARHPVTSPTCSRTGTRSSWAGRSSRVTGISSLIRPRPSASCGSARRSIPGCGTRPCWPTGWDCARPGPRCGWKPRRPVMAGCCCTTTGTAARA